MHQGRRRFTVACTRLEEARKRYGERRSLEERRKLVAGPNTILVIHVRGKDGKTAEEGEATCHMMDGAMKKALDGQDFATLEKKKC